MLPDKLHIVNHSNCCTHYGGFLSAELISKIIALFRHFICRTTSNSLLIRQSRQELFHNMLSTVHIICCLLSVHWIKLQTTASHITLVPLKNPLLCIPL